MINRKCCVKPQNSTGLFWKYPVASLQWWVPPLAPPVFSPHFRYEKTFAHWLLPRFFRVQKLSPVRHSDCHPTVHCSYALLIAAFPFVRRKPWRKMQSQRRLPSYLLNFTSPGIIQTYLYSSSAGNCCRCFWHWCLVRIFVVLAETEHPSCRSTLLGHVTRFVTISLNTYFLPRFVPLLGCNRY